MPAEPVPPRRRRPWSTSGWLMLVLLVVFAFGLIASRPPSPPDQGPPTGDVLAAQNAIDALVHPGPHPDALAELPKDFTALSGVTPGAMTARDGTVRAVHVDGGCSTPWGDDNTKWDYAVPCKAHDLGYDLLRYADRKGHPLGPEVRAALDDRLSTDMHHACDLNPMNSALTCRVVASLYSAGLVVNSWHQRWGPPVGDPIGPMVAGVLVIACLLVFRLRGWLRARREPRRTAPAPTPVDVSRWALLGAAGVVLLLVGESLTALAHWAGAAETAWWPLTWLTQLAPLIFFAGGHANAAGWRAEQERGGGYRPFLAERASPLLRPALIFAVVALLTPLALELLGSPSGTTATVMRIALHPLWLLGVYLLTIVCAPALLALHRRAPVSAAAGLLALVVGGEVAAGATGSPLPRYAATFALALLAQQLAFAHADGVRPSRRLLAVAAATGVA
ncbi:phospholipase A2, partial [Amycolatopsis solani]|uniref:phospholipase A2 n=1 Tax=Amycolatopsis solani TaxID=3028615 RepID=UPI0025AF0699